MKKYSVRSHTYIHHTLPHENKIMIKQKNVTENPSFRAGATATAVSKFQPLQFSQQSNVETITKDELSHCIVQV